MPEQPRKSAQKKYMYVVHDQFSSHPKIYYTFSTRPKALEWVKQQKNSKLMITRTSINPKPIKEDLSICQNLCIYS